MTPRISSPSFEWGGIAARGSPQAWPPMNRLSLLLTALLPAAVLLPPLPGQAVDPTLTATSPAAQAPSPAAPGAGSRSNCVRDDFDRANGPMSGPWTQVVGLQEIDNLRGRGLAGQTLGWMVHDLARDAYDQVRLECKLAPPDGTLQYVAMVSGRSGADMLFTKIQAADGRSDYEYAGFYVGHNGGGRPGYGGFIAIAPVRQGRVSAWVSDAGDTMNLDLDVDFDGVVDYHYESSGILSLGTAWGTEVGIGTWGVGSYDDWDMNRCGAEPRLAVANLVAGARAILQVVDSSPFAPVAFLYSRSGPGPLTLNGGSCGSFTLQLSPPIQVLNIVPAGPAGEVTIRTLVPAGASGRTVWIQALNLSLCAPSNGLAAVVV